MIALVSCAVLCGLAVFVVVVHAVEDDRVPEDTLLLVLAFFCLVPAVIALVLLGIARAVRSRSEGARMVLSVLAALVAAPSAMALGSLLFDL